MAFHIWHKWVSLFSTKTKPDLPCWIQIDDIEIQILKQMIMADQQTLKNIWMPYEVSKKKHFEMSSLDKYEDLNGYEKQK